MSTESQVVPQKTNYLGKVHLKKSPKKSFWIKLFGGSDEMANNKKQRNASSTTARSSSAKNTRKKPQKIRHLEAGSIDELQGYDRNTELQSGELQTGEGQFYPPSILAGLTWLLLWLGFFFHVINASPWEYIQYKYNDDLTSGDVRFKADVVSAINSTVVVTVFGFIMCFVVPAILVTLRVIYSYQCIPYDVPGRLILNIILYICFLICLILEIFYLIVFQDNAEDLRIDVSEFRFTSGWVSVGLWVVCLLVFISYEIYNCVVNGFFRLL